MIGTIRPASTESYRTRRARSTSSAKALVAIAVALALASLRLAAAPAAGAAPLSQVLVVQAIPEAEIGVERLAGLTWSPHDQALLAVDAGPGQADAVLVDPTGGALGAPLPLPASGSPATLAYDPAGRRLTLLDGNRLLSVPVARAGGPANPGPSDLATLGLRVPRAATFDPTSGTWLVLDDGGQTLRAVDLPRGAARTVSLEAPRPARFGAVAFNPLDGLVYLAGADDERLYAYTGGGQLRAVLDLAAVGLTDLRAMTFAPSADTTDDPAISSLYLADAGDAGTGTGQIVETALGPTGAVAPAPLAASSASLVATRDLSRLDPPSPDPSGITYIPGRDRLLVSDGEVEEMSIFEGANLFQLTRSGTLSTTGDTTTFSNEPTGLGFDPATGRLFVSDDDADEIYVILPGADGRYGTGDDGRSSFDTRTFGNSDAEGVTFDTSTGAVFIVDGVNREVFRRAPNGTVTQFDLGQYGAGDPEGIEYDAAAGTLLVVDQSPSLVYELTTSGNLVNTIDITAANAVKAAGVAVAPASTGSGTSLYVVDRGEDNDTNPNENDGALHELTYRASTANQPPTVSAGPDRTVNEGSAASLAGSVSDDGRPVGATVTSAWSKVSGPGTVTFASPASPATTATFSANGAYVLRLTANDTQLTGADETRVTVGTAFSVIDRPVGASSDDAEENTATGAVNVSSLDLELVRDSSRTQVVGLRFTGVNLPRGATIREAWLQFTVDEATPTPTPAAPLTVRGEAEDDPTTFAATAANISSRRRTLATVAWSPAGWEPVGVAGPNQRTPSLAAVVQEAVDRGGWQSGNALSFIVTGDGTRVATAFDEGTPPLLHVGYTK